MITTQERAAMFKEDFSLPDHLPYGEYIDGIFLQVDGSVGKIWELTLNESGSAAQVELDAFAHAIAGFVGRMPVGAHAQFIAWSDSDVAGLLAPYRALMSEDCDPVVKRIIDGKIAHLCEHPDGFWPSANEHFTPKRLRVFLTVRMFPERAQDGPRDWPRVRTEFLRTVHMIESQLQAIQCVFLPVDGEELTQLLYRMLNPRRARQVPQVRPQAGFIRDQVVYHSPEVSGSGFVLDGYHTRVVSLKDLPQATYTGMFAPMGALFDIHKDMLLAVNFIVPDQGKAMGRLKFQKAFAFIQRSSSMGDVSEEAVQKKEELSGLITQIFTSGKAIVQARMHVVLWGEDVGRLENACDALMVHLNHSGAEGLKEEIIAPSLLLTCLPLNFDHGFESFIRRERRLLSDNFADMAPVYGAMRGTPTPATMYLNRRGEPVGVDLFDSPTNPHAVIIGASGAGKSFLTNDLIYQNYRLGGRFFVLDKGHSYRKTCAILGGQYVHFDLCSPVTINPFVAAPTSENLAFLVEVLALMASGGDERDRLSREEKGFLQKAVLEAYDQAGEREVTLSDVTSVLKGEMGGRLALRLAPFTRDGQYGGFFDGPNQFVIDKRFTVFELAELSAYPDLQLVVLLNIMFFVTQFVADEKLRAERKFLLIDEAWQLLKMANTADFIANAFKTFRKYRCAAVAITQEVSDLLQQKSGLAILANTANKIFLKQEPVIIDQLKKELSFTEEIAGLLRSVVTVKGKYSEALVMTPSSTGVVRLVPDPLLYWAATSEPKDNAYLDRARSDAGGDLVSALEHCARAHPYGVR